MCPRGDWGAPLCHQDLTSPCQLSRESSAFPIPLLCPVGPLLECPLRPSEKPGTNAIPWLFARDPLPTHTVVTPFLALGTGRTLCLGCSEASASLTQPRCLEGEVHRLRCRGPRLVRSTGKRAHSRQGEFFIPMREGDSTWPSVLISQVQPEIWISM